MRYKITIEYDGTNYIGWQKQEGKFSIQKSIERAIELITKEKVQIFGCGRTDAGVHAFASVAHFDLFKIFEPIKLVSGINFFLKSEYLSKIQCNYIGNSPHNQDISIIGCEIVDENFHARFSAKKRFYQYRILNRKYPTALNNRRVWHVHKELNFDKMKESLKFLVGKSDWSSFRSSICQALSPIKTIEKVNLTKNNEEILFEIEAKSFLHHMVRNIVGTLVEIGLGKINMEDLQNIIESKDRKKAGPTAPACGLYLVKIEY